MKRRKFLVLSTLAIFCSSLGSLSLYREILSPKPVVILVKDYPAIGSPDASIEIIVFEDLVCHTCRYFSTEVFPAIQSTYIDRGIAQYVMIPLAFSSHSRELANAALAVYYQAPEQYFPFIQELFLRYSDTKKLELKDLIDLVSKVKGIDLVAFETSVKNRSFDTQLDHNLQVAKKAMKKNLHTPAIFINGYAMPGISFESLSIQIESLLTGKGSKITQKTDVTKEV